MSKNLKTSIVTSKTEIEEKTVTVSYSNFLSAMETFFRSMGVIPESKDLLFLTFGSKKNSLKDTLSMKLSLTPAERYKQPKQLDLPLTSITDDPLGR